jgi:hypothetical protein
MDPNGSDEKLLKGTCIFVTKYNQFCIIFFVDLLMLCFIVCFQNMLSKLKVAVIGQSTFASEVYKLLRKDGHKVVGVFTIPDKGNREDPLGRFKVSQILSHTFKS